MGEIIGDTFEVYKAIGYGNSWHPKVVGKFIPEKQGTLIDIQIRLRAETFYIFWNVALFAMFLIGFCSSKDKRFDDLIVVMLIPLAFSSFVYLIGWFAFNFEVYRIEEFIEQVFPTPTV